MQSIGIVKISLVTVVIDSITSKAEYFRFFLKFNAEILQVKVKVKFTILRERRLVLISIS